MAMTGGMEILVAQGTPSGWPGPICLYAYGKLVSQDREANTSKLSLGMYVTTPTGYYFGLWNDAYGSYIGTATSGSNCKSFNGACPANTQGTRWLAENLEVTVPHDDDGTKTATIYWKWGAASSWGGFSSPATGSFPVDLPAMPRATTLDSVSCATNYFNGNLTYRYTPKSASSYNRCVIALNQGGKLTTVKTINLGKKSAAQQTGTVKLSSSELGTIYDQLIGASSGVLRFTITTYSDSSYKTQIGEASYKEITLGIPNDSSTQPSVSIQLEPVGSLPEAFKGLYLQGKSKVKGTITATGKNGATIVSSYMGVGDGIYGADENYTSDYLSKYGDVTVYGYAQDSRGATGSTSKTIQVIAYADPKVIPVSSESDVVAARCDADGILSDKGTYLKIKAKRSWTAVTINGEQKNYCEVRYRYKARGASSYSGWTTLIARDSSSDEIVTGPLLGGVLSLQSTYLVQIQAIDDIGGYTDTEIVVPTDSVYMHRTRNAMGLGKYAEGENLLDVGWDAQFHGEVRIGASGMTLKEYILAVISEGG